MKTENSKQRFVGSYIYYTVSPLHCIKHFFCTRSDSVVSVVALRGHAPPLTLCLHLSSIQSKNCAAEAENALKTKRKKIFS